MKLKYVTILGSNLTDFKTFGKKIYDIKINRREYGIFYETEFTIIYKDKWHTLLFNKIKFGIKNLKKYHK